MNLNVRVIPNSRSDEISEEPGGLKVKLRAPAVEGKANAALIELLADYFRVKKRQVTILRGEKGRKKIVEISGI